MRNWIRVLKVILTQELPNGKFKNIVFGDNYPDYDLNIDVKINKYMSALQDNALISIDNLSYYDVIRIVNGKFFGVEIIAGYRDGNQISVFKGAILRISNTLNRDRTNTISILCGSNLIARFSQRYLNFSLQSGMNVYSAIKFLAARAGIKDGNISTQFKKDFIEQVSSETKTFASFLDDFSKDNPTACLNVDSGSGSSFSIFDAKLSNNRVIDLRNVQFIGRYPQLNSSGLTFTILPTFGFMCSDVVLIDNALISLKAVEDLDNITEQPGYYLDKNGAYMIISMNYHLCNRDSEFGLVIHARARSLISNYIGVA